MSALPLLGFSLVLEPYFGLFGLGVVLVRRATGSPRLGLVLAPFLWTALSILKAACDKPSHATTWMCSRPPTDFAMT